MSTSTVRPSVQTWLTTHTPHTETDDDSAVRAFVDPAVSEDVRLGILRAFDPSTRARFLGKLPSVVRDQLLGDTAMDMDVIRSHQTGAAYDFDFDHIPAHFDGLRGDVSRGMAILAKRAYEPYGADPSAAPAFAELIAQGYSVETFGAPDDSTQAFIAVKGNRVFFSARGTEPDQIDDLLVDAQVKKVDGYGGRVHGGFDRAVQEIWPQVQARLRGIAAEQGGQKLSVQLTGHSLGAAVATLVGWNVHHELSDIASVEGVYPFASPRVYDGDGALAFNQALGDRTFRYVNNADVVTRVPPARMGFAHVGLTLYLDGKGVLAPGAGRREVQRDHRRSWTNDHWFAKVRARGGEIESLWDHGAGGYVKHLHANERDSVDTNQTRRKLIGDELSPRNASIRSANRAIGLLAGMDGPGRAVALYRLPRAALRRLEKRLAPGDVRRTLLLEWLKAAPPAARIHERVYLALRDSAPKPAETGADAFTIVRRGSTDETHIAVSR